MSLDVIFRWKCDHCSNTHVQVQGDWPESSHPLYSMQMGSQILWSHLPRGWSVVGDEMVCPLHEVDIQLLRPRDQLEMACEVYSGRYASVPSPIPEELTPEQFKSDSEG